LSLPYLLARGQPGARGFRTPAPARNLNLKMNMSRQHPQERRVFVLSIRATEIFYVAETHQIVSQMKPEIAEEHPETQRNEVKKSE